jgi:hypothetical protein
VRTFFDEAEAKQYQGISYDYITAVTGGQDTDAGHGRITAV